MTSQNGKYRIGIDLGGTKTEVILLSPEHEEIFRKRRATPKEDGYLAIINNIVHLIDEAIHEVPSESQSSDGYTIGIGIPGIIDKESELVVNANTTTLIGNPLKKDLEKLLKHPLAVENDANCFTLAEALGGAAANYNFVFGVIMGTGCGGGICYNGEIRSGLNGIAGEWGHFSIHPDGPECFCGNRGCVERYISGSGVEEQYRRRTGQTKENSPKMPEIMERYREGEKAATETINQFLDDFGRAVGGIISVLDPDAVVIGGGVSRITELYTEGVARVKLHAFHKNIRTPILQNKLGDSAGVFGAAWIGI